MSTATTRSMSYARWVNAKRRIILAFALVLATGSALLAARLPIRADLANLLPPSAQSVKDLKLLKQRARAFGSLFVVVEAKDTAVRKKAIKLLEQRLSALDAGLVARIDIDDSPAKRYVWNNRFLFADLDDLRDARDAIKEKIKRAKLAANPLFVDLGDDDDDDDAASADDELEQRVAGLRKRLDDAEDAAKNNAGFVSKDGTMQMLVLRATFPSSDAKRDKKLLTAVHAAITQTRMELGPGVTIGITGNVVTTINEQRSIMHGLTQAALITVIICALALLLYFRSVLPVAASLWSLTVGTLVTFGIAKLTIGHLNMVTAFLAAIVVGNGINSGLILLARYFEEVRAGHMGDEGLAAAMAGAAHGTLAASLTAGVAYGSLIVTDFDGFRHFGIIGALGMVLCWISAFTVLPAALCELRHWGRIRPTKAPAIGAFLARIQPRRLGRVAALGAIFIIGASVLAGRYIASNPLQEDWRDLKPQGPETEEAVGWNKVIEDKFDKRFRRGTSSPMAIAVQERSQTAQVVAELRTLIDGKPVSERLLASIRSMDDLLPPNQVSKTAILTEIRNLIDSELADDLDAEDQKLLERLRPPESVRVLTLADIPEDLGWKYTERDGSRGKLIIAGRGERFESWNILHWVEIAQAVRSLNLPEGVILGGKAFVFSDMIRAMQQDGPKATIVALIGAFLCVWLIVGINRHGVVTLICGGAGIVGMIALVALWGLEVNVIDFIALPITVGIGIDYAVNIAARDRSDHGLSPKQLLSTTGGAVLLCSFTTIVGYGSLLLSDSGGIRSFGLAAILGEVACLFTALAFAPALLTVMRSKSSPSSDGDMPSSSEPPSNTAKPSESALASAGGGR